MPWVALENIDLYKKGEVVPDEKAVIWNQMYEVSPVGKLDSKGKKVEVKVPEEPEKELKVAFKTELSNIKGIGSKIVRDIVQVYPNKEALLEAMKGDKVELPFRDDIVEKLIDAFKE